MVYVVIGSLEGVTAFNFVVISVDMGEREREVELEAKVGVHPDTDVPQYNKLPKQSI